MRNTLRRYGDPSRFILSVGSTVQYGRKNERKLMMTIVV
jgi:hypothetical protein